MKLYIAFNTPDAAKALKQAKLIEHHCDGFILGHLLLLSEGIKALKEFRKKFPEKYIICDTQVIDHEKETVQLFGREETDAVTTLAGADNRIIHTTCSTAQELGKKVYLDLSDSSSFGQAALEAQSLGVHFLIFRSPYNEQDKHVFIDRWEMTRGNTKLPIFIATQVTKDTLHDIIKLRPEGLILGCSVLDHEDPKTVVSSFYEILKEH